MSIPKPNGATKMNKPEILIEIKPASLGDVLNPEFVKQARDLEAIYRDSLLLLQALKRVTPEKFDMYESGCAYQDWAYANDLLIKHGIR